MPAVAWWLTHASKVLKDGDEAKQGTQQQRLTCNGRLQTASDPRKRD